MKFSKFILILVPFLLIAACKKKKAFNEEDGQSSVDVMTASAANEEVMADVNASIGSQGILRGKSSQITATIFPLPCSLSIDTLEIFKGLIKLNYNGAVCNNRKREGMITVTTLNYPLKKWKNKGCAIQIEYINYKVTNTLSGKSVSIKGTVTLTNESGGTWYELWFTGQPNLVYSLKATDLKMNFDGSNAQYNLSRKLTYTFKSAGKVTTCVVEGTGTNGDKSNLESWGSNRDGNFFTSQVTTALKWSTSCGAGVLTEGAITVKVDSKDFDLRAQFAVDEGGNDVSGDTGTCPYGWKLSWSYKKKTNTRIFPYN